MSLIITAGDIERAASKGETSFIVPPGAIVTPLAREEARARGVVISAEHPGATEGARATTVETADPPTPPPSSDSSREPSSASGQRGGGSPILSFGVSAHALTAVWDIEAAAAAPHLPPTVEPTSGRMFVSVQDVVCVPSDAPEAAFMDPSSSQWREAYVALPCLEAGRAAHYIVLARSDRSGGWMGLAGGHSVARTRLIGQHVDLGAHRAGVGFRGLADGIALTVRTRKKDAPDIIPALGLVLVDGGRIVIEEGLGSDCLSGDAQVQLEGALDNLVPQNDRILGLDYTYSWRAIRKEAV